MTTTDTAATASIEAAARELKLPVVRASAARLAADAKRSKLSYLGFLAEILEAEVDARSDRRRTRRILDAKFPRMKRLADFDLDAAPTIEPAVIATLATNNYIRSGDPVVLLGDSGTGKSHLLIGLGLAACEAGLRARYITAAQLANELAEAADERRLSRIVARYGRLDLLCLDELGYVQLDARGHRTRRPRHVQRSHRRDRLHSYRLLTTQTRRPPQQHLNRRTPPIGHRSKRCQGRRRR